MALAATGAPSEALVEASAQLAALDDPKQRPETEATQAFYVAALTGDFDAAARSLDDLTRARAGAPTPGEPATPVELWLPLLRETGDAARAATVAREFLRRLPSYNAPSRRIEIIDAVAALVATGEMTRQDADSRIRAVIEANAPPAPYVATRAPFVVGAYALTVDDEATEGEILATYANPLPPLDLPARIQDVGGAPTIERGLGKALVVTGDVERGAPLLEQASRACDILGPSFGQVARSPFDHIRGLFWLGFAREKQGDAAGACEAYGRVLGYWGHAKPHSVTADKARARATKLGCAL
jgi:hypothetical protein